MKTFILHWRDGSTNKVTGDDIVNAFNRAGFGRGSLPAFDYFEEVPTTIRLTKEDQELVDGDE